MKDMAGLQLSPLQLNKYFIKELHYAVKDEFDDKYDQATAFPYPQLTARVEHTQEEEKDRDWRFELTLESEDSQSIEFPYSLKIVLVGYFTIAEDYPSERVEMLAHVNGPSLLYSAAREALVTITGRSGYPAIVLPSVMFLQHALNVSQSKQGGTTGVKTRSVLKGSVKGRGRGAGQHRPSKETKRKGAK